MRHGGVTLLVIFFAVLTISSIGVPSICAIYTRVPDGINSWRFSIFATALGVTSIEKLFKKFLSKFLLISY